MGEKKFNVRVYGILSDEKNRVLVSDEIIKGKFVTKFPGGGLEFGEGTHDCLIREFMEEAGITVSITSHLYTTDFFQQSAFNPDHQILSIYYTVQTGSPEKIKTSEKKFDFAEVKNDTQSFRWVNMVEIHGEEFTFPIDQKVADLLFDKMKQNN